MPWKHGRGQTSESTELGAVPKHRSVAKRGRDMKLEGHIVVRLTSETIKGEANPVSVIDSTNGSSVTLEPFGVVITPPAGTDPSSILILPRRRVYDVARLSN